MINKKSQDQKLSHCGKDLRSKSVHINNFIIHGIFRVGNLIIYWFFQTLNEVNQLVLTEKIR